MRTFLRSAGALLLGVTALAIATSAAAVTRCVSTAAGLDTALKEWANNATPVTIQIEQGTYVLPSVTASMDYENLGSTHAPLQLLGGFTTNCASRELYAANTIIEGEGSLTKTDFVIAWKNADVMIQGITFRKMHGVGLGLNEGGTGPLTVNNVVVTDMRSDDGGCAIGYGASEQSDARFENVLIYNNHAAGGLCVNNVDLYTQYPSAAFIFLNSTITNNSGFGIILNGGVTFFGYNDIIWGHQLDLLRGIRLFESTNVPGPAEAFHLSYSDFATVQSVVSSGINVVDTTGNLNIDPQFYNPSAGDFNLKPGSPLINKGAPSTLVYSGGGYSALDLADGKRVIGSAIDMGAYESNVDDTTPQVVTVTTTIDSVSAGSLRSAINTANASSKPTTIKFNIPGACPQIFKLTSALPDITNAITIDGTTQPGSKVNTQTAGYDGQLCVVLSGGTLIGQLGVVDHAFKTTSLNYSHTGRLTVKGIEFERFVSAIRLAAGSGHKVIGNGFGTAGYYSNGMGVRIEGTAANAQIGTIKPGDRNVFDQASNAAIDLESNGLERHHHIEGNYIGFNLDGTLWSGFQNSYGIKVYATGGNTISHNYIGSSQNDGLYLGGINTTNNIVQFNIIGLAPTSSGFLGPLPAAGNYGDGIRLAGGAHDNVIGAFLATNTSGGNLIVHNLGPGVWVQNGAGTGNLISGNNQIYANGNGGQLAIDLDNLSGTANDASDADTGPNNLQNYPKLSKATRVATNTLRVSGYLVAQGPLGPKQKYSLDVYWTDTCVATTSGTDSPRGELKKYAGRFSLPADGAAGFLPFSDVNISIMNVPTGGYFSASATSGAGTNNTSEPGPCVPAT